MSEHKHTPGPWLHTGKTVYALNEDGFNRFSALVQDAHTEDSELKANAHLIAAAPELLDALRELVACKRMKEQIAIQQGLVIETDEDMEEMDRIMSDYARRKPKAWENAALILAKATGAKE